MSENGTGLELLGFLGGTAKSKEAEAQKKLDQYEYLMEKYWWKTRWRTFDRHPVYPGN